MLVTYNWVQSEWSTCTTDCGVSAHNKERTVSCFGSDDPVIPVDDSLCSESKPVTVIPNACPQTAACPAEFVVGNHLTLQKMVYSTLIILIL